MPYHVFKLFAYNIKNYSKRSTNPKYTKTKKNLPETQLQLKLEILNQLLYFPPLRPAANIKW